VGDGDVEEKEMVRVTEMVTEIRGTEDVDQE
jgi:hypothetical protein